MVEIIGKVRRYPVKKYAGSSLAAAFTPEEFEAILADIKYERDQKNSVNKNVYICKPNNIQHHE